MRGAVGHKGQPRGRLRCHGRSSAQHAETMCELRHLGSRLPVVSAPPYWRPRQRAGGASISPVPRNLAPSWCGSLVRPSARGWWRRPVLSSDGLRTACRVKHAGLYLQRTTPRDLDLGRRPSRAATAGSSPEQILHVKAEQQKVKRRLLQCHPTERRPACRCDAADRPARSQCRLALSGRSSGRCKLETLIACG